MTYFQIDLLKGQCLPTKSKPIVVALAIVPLLIVLLVLAGMLMSSVQGGIVVAGKEKQLLRLDKEIGALAGDVAYVKARNQAISQSRTETTDIEKHATTQVQYTPILQAVAFELPENLVLTSLDVVPRSRQKNRPHPDEPNRMITTVSTERTIHITVCDVADGQPVSAYVLSLRQSPALSWLIEKIEPTARDADRIAGREVVSYDIDCRLLPR